MIQKLNETICQNKKFMYQPQRGMKILNNEILSIEMKVYISIEIVWGSRHEKNKIKLL